MCKNRESAHSHDNTPPRPEDKFLYFVIIHLYNLKEIAQILEKMVDDLKHLNQVLQDSNDRHNGILIDGELVQPKSEETASEATKMSEPAVSSWAIWQFIKKLIDSFQKYM